MWRKRIFNRIGGLYSRIKARAMLYADQHPKTVIAAMFFILLSAVTGLLVTRSMNRQGYGSEIDKIYAQINAGANPQKKMKRPITSEILDMLSIYNRAKAINPDSLTAEDSVLLKEIDDDLNKIIADEKD